MTNVLIVFESKYGSTAEIADRLGANIRDAAKTATALRVTVSPAKTAPPPDGYDAIIIGSAVYIARWRKQVSGYLLRHQKTLAQKRVWLFSSGPTGSGDPVELLNGWTMPVKLQEAVAGIRPIETIVFHGAVFMDRLGFFDRLLATKVDSPVGDFRDWEMVAAFAQRIAKQL